MRVYVDGKVHNSLIENVGIRFTEQDLEFIRTMKPGFDTYVSGPKENRDELMKITNILKPDAPVEYSEEDDPK